MTALLRFNENETPRLCLFDAFQQSTLSTYYLLHYHEPFHHLPLLLYHHYTISTFLGGGEKEEDKKPRKGLKKRLVNCRPVLRSRAHDLCGVTNWTNSSLLRSQGKLLAVLLTQSVARPLLSPKLLVADGNGLIVGFQEWRGA